MSDKLKQIIVQHIPAPPTDLENVNINSLIELYMCPELLAAIFKHISVNDNLWRSSSAVLFDMLGQIALAHNPSMFFELPGREDSVITLPPVTRWPQVHGWTFNCWVYLDRIHERSAPYLYSFQTHEGSGFTAHFEGTALVITSFRLKSKGLQHFVRFNFMDLKWYMITIVHVYNRWGPGEIQCFVNGVLLSSTEITWSMTSQQAMTKCIIGGSTSGKDIYALRGRLTNVMGFREALSADQILAIYSLGGDYQGEFRFEGECGHRLSNDQRKSLYLGARLHNTLMFLYLPMACDQNLCLNRASRSVSVFSHSGHAFLSGGVVPHMATSVHSALHSLGGFQVVYPFFERLHLSPGRKSASEPHSSDSDPGSLATSVIISLLEFIFNLTFTCPVLAGQLVQSKGLLLVATALKASKTCQHFTPQLVTVFIRVTRYLFSQVDSVKHSAVELPASLAKPVVTIQHTFQLLRHLHGYILGNPDVWVRAPIQVQNQLYDFLTSEFLHRVIQHGCVSRTSSVLQAINTIKYYFSLTEPQVGSGFTLKTPNNRPLYTTSDLLQLRAKLLIFIKQTFISQGGIADAEMHAILSFLITVSDQDENLHDVLYLLITMLATKAFPTVSSVLLRNDGLQCAVHLLSSRDEHIRVYAIKLIGFCLRQARNLKSDDVMDRYRLFALIAERLNSASSRLTMLTYNALFEVMTEWIPCRSQTVVITNIPKEVVIRNPSILRVIVHLMKHSEPTSSLLLIKQIFLQHLLILCLRNSDNKRAILQLTVWQDLFFCLVPYPLTAISTMSDTLLLASLFHLLRCLLFHAVRYESDGWRVWIDTQALLHLRLSVASDQTVSRELPTTTNAGETYPPPEEHGDVGVDLTEPDAARQLLRRLTADQGSPVQPSPPPPANGAAAGAGRRGDVGEAGDTQFVSEVAGDDAETHQLPPRGSGATPNTEQADGIAGGEGTKADWPPTRFQWSPLHLLLLDDLLTSIEIELHIVSTMTAGSSLRPPVARSESTVAIGTPTGGADGVKTGSFALDNDDEGEHGTSSSSNSSNIGHAAAMLGDPSNETFCVNLLHLLSDCADILVNACGGLLPLLAAATSLSADDVGIFESVNGITVNDAFNFLLRVAYLTDLCLLYSGVETGLVEQQRGFTEGSMIRQFARVYLTTAVRNCLETRLFKLVPPASLVVQLRQFTNELGTSRFVEFANQTATGSGGRMKQNVSLGRGTASGQSGGRYSLLPSPAVTASAQQQMDWESDITAGASSPPPTVGALALNGLPAAATGDSHLDLEASANWLFCLLKVSEGAGAGATSDPVRLGLAVWPWRCAGYLRPDQLFSTMHWLQQADLPVRRHLSSLRSLVFSLRTGFSYRTVSESAFVQAVLQPLEKPCCLLQTRDLGRLRALVYKAEESTKTTDLLVSAFAYFVSILVVSKYRDFLQPTVQLAQFSWHTQEEGRRQPAFLTSPAASATSSDGPSDAGRHSARRSLSDSDSVTVASDEDEESVSIESGSAAMKAGDTADCDKEEHSLNSAATSPVSPDDVTELVKVSLASCTSFLREIFIEFSSHFSKLLLGSHGQSLTNSKSYIHCFLKDRQLPIEMVMLLCSREWQDTLKKHVGLAFIELVNEGRVLGRCRLEYFQRVAMEASHLLPQLTVINQKRCHDFELLSTRVLKKKLEDDRLCDTITSSIRRNDYLSVLQESHLRRLSAKLLDVATISQPADNRSVWTAVFYRLDSWEDNSRRRCRLSPNPHGSSHQEAALLEDASVPAGGRSIVPKEADLARLQTALKKCGAVTRTSEFEAVESMEGHSAGIAGQVNATAGYQSATLFSDGLFELEGFEAQADDDISSISLLMKPDATSVVLSLPCSIVAMGVTIDGKFYVSTSDFRFQPSPTAGRGISSLSKNVLAYMETSRMKWSLSEIQAIFSRQYLHSTRALEVFVKSRSSVLFVFNDEGSLQRVVAVLPPVGVGTKYGLPKSRSITLTTPRQLFAITGMTQRWQRREISNFDYLIYLNTIAGRSYHDLNQYPVFPWILTNYTTSELDLNEPDNFRDLSKPMGALDPERKAVYDERYATWDDEEQPAFHYGTHYSTAAFVLNYLVRVEPFTTMFLNLQDGKFDHPNRMFASVKDTWERCQCNTTDVKELIPEFFYLPEMFENLNRLPLGTRDDGLRLDAVHLPPWAGGSPHEFIRIHRQALESELVSCQLHHWIDLIFGYKQRGVEAVRATNVFHHFTYQGSVDWSKLTNPVLLKAVEDQIQCFGQTPAQLLTEPHPCRSSALHLNPLVFGRLAEEVCMLVKFQSHSPVVFLACHTAASTPPGPAIVTVTEKRAVLVSRWDNSAAGAAYQGALMTQRYEPATLSPTTGQETVSVTTQVAAEPHHVDDLPSTPAADESSGDMVAAAVTQLAGQRPPLKRDNLSRPAPAPHVILSNDTGGATPQVTLTCLGTDFDQRLPTYANQFTTTGDNRGLVACGYSDHSFRIFSLETGRLLQAVFGHFGVVTCLGHSEYQPGNHCYLVSGSRDYTVKLWIYNRSRLTVHGADGSNSPSPLTTLTGHRAPVTAVSISAELGLVLSGSLDGTCLLHTTRGVLLRQLANPAQYSDLPNPRPPSAPSGSDPPTASQRWSVNCLLYHRNGYLIGQFGRHTLVVYSLNGQVIACKDMQQLAATSVYQVTAVLFGASHDYLLAGGSDGVVWVLRSHSLNPLHVYSRCDAPVRSLSLTTDQRFLVVGLANGSLTVFFIDFSQWHHEFQERYLN